MAETTTGMTSTTNTGSPLAAFGRGARRKRKRPVDVENAADARKPGDAAEDAPATLAAAARRRKAKA